MKTLGQKPTLAEMLEYYGRADVSSFMYESCLKRKICMLFVPEMRWSASWRDNFLTLESPDHLQQTIINTFGDEMKKLPEDEPMSFYPSFHATADMLDDYKDLVLEADRRGWRQSFDDLYGAIQILDEFQVTYRIKFSGHRSLHLMVPWEVFPENFGDESVKDQWQEIRNRVKSYFTKYGDLKWAHRPGGILRVAYSLNENSGLVSMPIARNKLEDFRPWEANMYNVKVDQPWFGDVSEEAKENTEKFLDEVFSDTLDSKISILIGGIRIGPKDTSSYASDSISVMEQIENIHSGNEDEQTQAAWNLMVSDKDIPIGTLTKALQEADGAARWFLTEALHRNADQESAIGLALALILDEDEYVRVSAADLIIRAFENEPISSVEVLADSPANRIDISYIICKACAQNADVAEDVLQSLVDYTIKVDTASVLAYVLPLLNSLVSDRSMEREFEQTGVPAFINRERMKRRKSIFFTMLSNLLIIMSYNKMSRESLRIIENFWPNNALARLLSLKLSSALEIDVDATRKFRTRISGEDSEETIALIDNTLEEISRDGKINMLITMLLHGRKPTRTIAGKTIKMLGKDAVEPIIVGIQSGELYSIMLSAGSIAEVLKAIDPDPVKSLMKPLKSENIQVQQSTLLVLRALGRRKAIRPLSEMLKDRRIRLRVFVVRALGGIRGKKANEVLIDALKDRNRQVRMEVIKELKERIKSPDVANAINSCLHDRSKHIRAMAREIMIA